MQEIYNEALSPSVVYLTFDTKLNKNVILKKIIKNKLNRNQDRQAMLECQVQCALKQYNLVNAYYYYETQEEYGIVMEVVDEADYFIDRLENNHKCINNELKLKIYIADILEGLKYIHSQGYIHCDLKLANLFCTHDKNSKIRRIKIGDFGLVHKIDPITKKCKMNETCGTYGFKAPESISGNYITQKVDIWSIGIIVYVMSVAYFPHMIKGYKYGDGPIPFRNIDWRKKNPLLKNFVESLLQLNPENRPTVEEALNHQFLNIKTNSQNNL